MWHREKDIKKYRISEKYQAIKRKAGLKVESDSMVKYGYFLVQYFFRIDFSILCPYLYL